MGLEKERDIGGEARDDKLQPIEPLQRDLRSTSGPCVRIAVACTFNLSGGPEREQDLSNNFIGDTLQGSVPPRLKPGRQPCKIYNI